MTKIITIKISPNNNKNSSNNEVYSIYLFIFELERIVDIYVSYMELI